MSKLTHVNEEGKARMVDIGRKARTRRRARASARVVMSPETIEAIRENKLKKGDVLAVRLYASGVLLRFFVFFYLLRLFFFGL